MQMSDRVQPEPRTAFKSSGGQATTLVDSMADLSQAVRAVRPPYPQVKVTFVENPGNFYIQHVDPESKRNADVDE